MAAGIKILNAVIKTKTINIDVSILIDRIPAEPPSCRRLEIPATVIKQPGFHFGVFGAEAERNCSRESSASEACLSEPIWPFLVHPLIRFTYHGVDPVTM